MRPLLQGRRFPVAWKPPPAIWEVISAKSVSYLVERVWFQLEGVCFLKRRGTFQLEGVCLVYISVGGGVFLEEEGYISVGGVHFSWRGCVS